jgi:hypothetical protein
VSGRGALAKVTVNGTIVVTATFLYQVPDKKHLVKRYVPVENLPYALCRGRPSANCRGQNCLCPWHSAKHAYPVVHRMDWLELSIIPLKKEAEEKKKSEKVFSIYFS